MGTGSHIRTRCHTAPGLRRSRRSVIWVVTGALGLSVLPGAPLPGTSPIALAQQVYSFADIMAALTVRLPTGQTVTSTQPLTLQEAVRSLTLEQAVRTPANVARIAGVMIQVRHDETTRTAVHDGIATALDSLVTTGRIAPLGRDLMLEQVSVALGITGSATNTAPPPTDPASAPVSESTVGHPSGDGPSATPTAPMQDTTPTPAKVLPPPDVPVIAAPMSQTSPASQTPVPGAVASQQPPLPRAAPVTSATLATLASTHLASPTPPPMPSPSAVTAAPFAAPETAQASTSGVSTISAHGTAPSPWLGLGPIPGNVLFPSTVDRGALMDLPAEVTAPPATVADSGS